MTLFLFGFLSLFVVERMGRAIDARYCYDSGLSRSRSHSPSLALYLSLVFLSPFSPGVLPPSSPSPSPSLFLSGAPARTLPTHTTLSHTKRL